MPIIKSAKKRMEITAICNAANTSMRTRLKNAVKKFNTAIEANDIEAAEKLLPETIAVIDKSCSYGIIHKNAAARKKAHAVNEDAVVLRGCVTCPRSPRGRT